MKFSLLLIFLELHFAPSRLGFQWASRVKTKITGAIVDGLPINQKVYEIYDETLVGFLVRVLPSGLKSFGVRYRLPDGKRDRIVLGRHGVITVAQARYEARKILGQVTTGNNPKRPKREVSSNILTLESFIENEYIAWSETHHQWSSDHIKRLARFTDFLNLPLNDINPLLVEKWRADRLKNKLSASTVNRNLAALRSVLSKAVEWGHIENHPLRRLKQLKVDRSPNVRYLSIDEELRLRKALDDREAKLREDRFSGNAWRAERGYELYPDLTHSAFVDYLKPLVILSLNTGARRGELFRLQWEDIDFDRKSMALVMRGKRKSHTRHIPLNKEAFETLLGWRSMQTEKDKMVFPSKDGKKLDNTQTSWENIRKAARVNNFRWHDMRHHFASRLVMNGVPLNTVRELLGHTNLEMTLRYAHLAPEQKERAVATLDIL